jgi:quercetin dioxygenase-like cupin family protein
MPMTMREEIRIGGVAVRFVLDASETGGAVSAFEFDVPAGARVPTPHSHDGFDETAYVLRGQLTWTVDGRRVEVGEGGALFIERGAVHHFENEGEADATALAVVTPGLLGPAYFQEMAAVVEAAMAAGQPPDVAELMAVMRRHGLTPAPPAAS